MMSVVGYVRCTTGSGKAMADRGEKIIRDWAQENNVMIRKIVREKVPGTSPVSERPGFLKAIMVSLLYNCDAVAVPDMRMLGKGEDNIVEMCNICFRNDIGIQFVEEGLLAEKGMSRETSNRIMDLACTEKPKPSILMHKFRKIKRRLKRKGSTPKTRRGVKKTDKQLMKEYSEVITLLNDGVSIRKTAKRLNLSPSTVQKVKNKFINAEKYED